MFSKSKVVHCILYASIPAILFYIVSVCLLLFAWDFNLIEILRDPAQQSGQSSLIGFISNIGTWLWISSTAICFFAAFISYQLLRSRVSTFLLLIGLLSLVLAVDDFFLIHDRYINEYLCYGTYALLIVTILSFYHKEIIKINPFNFLLSGSLLALSIITDIFQDYFPLEYSYTQFFEEGFKFVGIATWLYFCSSAAAFAIDFTIKKQTVIKNL